MELIFLTILFQIFPFIYSISIDRREQFTAITSNYHVVDEHHEKYQLLGGEYVAFEIDNYVLFGKL